MTEYKWVKYRTMHSSGPNPRKGWNWREVEVNDHTTIIDVLNSLDEQLRTPSEHWRGVEGDFADPPREVVRKEWDKAHGRKEKALDAMRRYEELLIELDNAVGASSDVH